MKKRSAVFAALSIALTVAASREAQAQVPRNSQSISVFSLEACYFVADIADAGTDDDVFITLNNQSNLFFQIDLVSDDFERNDWTCVMLPYERWGISNLSQIRHVSTRLEGNDDLIIDTLMLNVNDQVSLDVVTPELPSLWLGDDNPSRPTAEISTPLLPYLESDVVADAADTFALYEHRRNLTIPVAEIERMLEARVGHELSALGRGWRDTEYRPHLRVVRNEAMRRDEYNFRMIVVRDVDAVWPLIDFDDMYEIDIRYVLRIRNGVPVLERGAWSFIELGLDVDPIWTGQTMRSIRLATPRARNARLDPATRNVVLELSRR